MRHAIVWLENTLQVSTPSAAGGAHQRRVPSYLHQTLSAAQRNFGAYRLPQDTSTRCSDILFPPRSTCQLMCASATAATACNCNAPCVRLAYRILCIANVAVLHTPRHPISFFALLSRCIVFLSSPSFAAHTLVIINNVMLCGGFLHFQDCVNKRAACYAPPIALSLILLLLLLLPIALPPPSSPMRSAPTAPQKPS